MLAKLLLRRRTCLPCFRPYLFAVEGQVDEFGEEEKKAAAPEPSIPSALQLLRSMQEMNRQYTIRRATLSNNHLARLAFDENEVVEMINELRRSMALTPEQGLAALN